MDIGQRVKIKPNENIRKLAAKLMGDQVSGQLPIQPEEFSTEDKGSVTNIDGRQPDG